MKKFSAHSGYVWNRTTKCLQLFYRAPRLYRLYKTSKIERQNSTPFSRYSGETVLNFDPLLRYGMNREFFKGYTAIRVLPYARRHGIYLDRRKRSRWYRLIYKQLILFAQVMLGTFVCVLFGNVCFLSVFGRMADAANRIWPTSANRLSDRALLISSSLIESWLDWSSCTLQSAPAVNERRRPWVGSILWSIVVFISFCSRQRAANTAAAAAAAGGGGDYDDDELSWR